MQAERMMLETDDNGHLTTVPTLPPRVRIEAIFLLLDETSKTKCRQPPPEIAGKGRIIGDILSPVVEPEEWNELR